MAALLDAVKKSVRIMSSTDFDDELSDIIDACLADLRICGIILPTDSAENDDDKNDKSIDDPLIKRAVILYAKAHFGDDPNSEKFFHSYTLLKISLALSNDYAQEGDG